MESIAIIRNAKFWGLKFSDEFMVDYKKTIGVYNKILSHMRNEIVKGRIQKISRFNIYHVDGTEFDEKTGLNYYSAAGYVRDVLDDKGVFDGARDKCQTFKRMMLFYAMERYLGYANRNNNKKIPTITIKENKSLYYKESNLITVDLENKKLIVKTLYGEHDIPFSYCIKAEHIKPKGKSKTITTGGNFVMNQGSFIAAVKFEKNVLYTPKSVISFDLNKKKEDWLAFNNGEKISQPKDIQTVLAEINRLNGLLDADKSKPVPQRLLRTKARSKVRKEWINEQAKLKKLILPVVRDIIKETVKSQSLLCIDSVATGAGSGTFGQCKIIPELVTLCENNGIPFYVVPCAYTSQRCSSCGHTEKANRPTTEQFICQSCDHKCDAQINGALNIAYHGKRMYDAGVPYGSYARRRVDALIEEYSQQQDSVCTSEVS